MLLIFSCVATLPVHFFRHPNYGQTRLTESQLNQTIHNQTKLILTRLNQTKSAALLLYGPLLIFLTHRDSRGEQDKFCTMVFRDSKAHPVLVRGL